ncbi:family 10 glycosylhydrolase [Thermoleptolyngbya sichuanensis A183]|uniref:Family 10 glycosylhydrolase n=1 Tax=Thermoleptolyngbya sichuanensis A183 TaxID=2737172 RepID=A0A6M8B697_9CYAN|nr:family 10 glycosylhydrolase [Thermoleptolyngbya sichuanensis A183]
MTVLRETGLQQTGLQQVRLRQTGLRQTGLLQILAGLRWRGVAKLLVAVLLTGSQWGLAGSRVAEAQIQPYCNFSAEDITQKQTFLVGALQGDRNAGNRYRNLIEQHGDRLRRCRRESWLKNQAVWLRLYPCDARPGAIEYLMDQIVNRGYNQVYVEVFGGGQVLLPRAENNTPWPSVVRTPGFENRDLLAEAIAKGRERGLQVYAWMFSMNFGHTYAQRPGAEQILARNGRGQNSMTFNGATGINSLGEVVSEEVFIDPYNPQAKLEFYNLAQAIARRRPDGMLFDYIRYPKGNGNASVAGRVQDLWVYSPASQQALLQRALNPSGQDLIRRFLQRGYVTAQDIQDIATAYPLDGQPLWQGRSPDPLYASLTPDQARPSLQTELWQLSVAHAFQGVLDFLTAGTTPAQQVGIPAGVVFFPEGNQTVGAGGYDSRLQFWERFPSNLEWHPMSYATCGRADCIVRQVQRVLAGAPAGTRVMPVLAGTWGRSVSNRPPLETQMQSIRQSAPQINAISHFALSWQDPEGDRTRKSCRLP